MINIYFIFTSILHQNTISSLSHYLLYYYGSNVFSPNLCSSILQFGFNKKQQFYSLSTLSISQDVPYSFFRMFDTLSSEKITFLETFTNLHRCFERMYYHYMFWTKIPFLLMMATINSRPIVSNAKSSLCSCETRVDRQTVE